MIAYKFRAASAADHIFDIILNRRLYCADWRKLNDPVEGIFTFQMRSGSASTYERLLREISSEKNRLKVCSLSGTFDRHLLWSHYADGFNGVAIEIDLPDNNQNIRKVDYRGVYAIVDGDGELDAWDVARRVLFSKYNEWSYEDEVRILHDHDFFHLVRPIRRLIVGHRMEGAMLDALRIICKAQGIPIYRIGIGDEGLDADPLEIAPGPRPRRGGGARNIEEWEIALIKGLLADGSYTKDQIVAYFTRPDRTVNPFRVSEIDKGEIGANVEAAPPEVVFDYVSKFTVSRHVMTEGEVERAPIPADAE